MLEIEFRVVDFDPSRHFFHASTATPSSVEFCQVGSSGLFRRGARNKRQVLCRESDHAHLSRGESSTVEHGPFRSVCSSLLQAMPSHTLKLNLQIRPMKLSQAEPEQRPAAPPSMRVTCMQGVSAANGCISTTEALPKLVPVSTCRSPWFARGHTLPVPEKMYL